MIIVMKKFSLWVCVFTVALQWLQCIDIHW